jgi:hypothetical protein
MRLDVLCDIGSPLKAESEWSQKRVAVGGLFRQIGIDEQFELPSWRRRLPLNIGGVSQSSFEVLGRELPKCHSL